MRTGKLVKLKYDCFIGCGTNLGDLCFNELIAIPCPIRVITLHIDCNLFLRGVSLAELCVSEL